VVRKLLNVIMSPLVVAWTCLLMILVGIVAWCSWVYVPNEAAPRHSVTITMHLNKDEAPLVESMEGAEQGKGEGRAQIISAIPPEKSTDHTNTAQPHEVAAELNADQTVRPVENSDIENAAASQSEQTPAPQGEGGRPVLTEEPVQAPNEANSVEEAKLQSPSGVQFPPKSEWPAYKYSQKTPHEEAAPHRIVVVLKGVGLETAAALKAIDNLPSQIVIAFSAYSPDLPALVKHSHERGHESLVVVPMEPDDFPVNDPGPMALLSSYSAERNLQHLDQALEHANGIVGISHTMGHVLASQKAFLQPVVEDVLKRGLIWFDVHALVRSQAAALVRDNGGLYIRPNLLIDDEVSKQAIDQNLEKLEAIALKDGTAVGVAMPYPVTLDRLATWAEGLQTKGIELVCLTAIVEQQASVKHVQ